MSERIDVEIYNRGLSSSREKAKNLLENNNITVNGKLVTKPSFKVERDDVIEVVGEVMPYVSRGGLKLARAIEKFGIELCGKTAVDMGASTGGFSDCMLQNGVKKVYAVDVGSGQLAEKLRQNPSVVNMENTNIRNLTKNDIPDKIDFISIDTSFISLKYILPVAFELLDDSGEIAALVKPQFEAGKGNIGKNGIVKDKNVRAAVLKDIYGFVTACGYCPKNLAVSPITGGDGNIEYLMHIVKNGTPFGEDLIKKEVLK